MSLCNLVNFSYRFWKLVIFHFFSSQRTQKKLFPIFSLHKWLQKSKMATINRKLPHYRGNKNISAYNYGCYNGNMDVI